MMDRPDRNIQGKWHSSINQYVDENELFKNDFPHIMYEAQRAADEVPRLASLFKLEREGQLPKIHKQCSHSSPVEIEDNHLTCCRGVECRACPMLLALEKADMPPDEIDLAKAWTCAAHILSDHRTFDTSEGYVLTTDDRMYWDNVYSSLAGFDNHL